VSQVNLTPIEKRLLRRLQKGEILCRELSPRESGAVPGLVQKGLVEVFSKNLSTTRVKKHKLIRLKSQGPTPG